MGMVEIRMHGRGGQGTVIASKILASAAIYESRYSQAFPEFGVERRGSPVEAFTRISETKIYIHSKIYEPDHVIVLDPTLIGFVDILRGLKAGGIILINSQKDPDEFDFWPEYRVATVNANSIAIRHGLGNRLAPVVNTAIIGAFVRVSGIVNLESVLLGIEDEVPIKKEKNKFATKDAYQEVKIKGI